MKITPGLYFMAHVFSEGARSTGPRKRSPGQRGAGGTRRARAPSAALPFFARHFSPVAWFPMTLRMPRLQQKACAPLNGTARPLRPVAPRLVP